MRRLRDGDSVIVMLTREEAEVVDDYIFRKAERLKDAQLEDSFCYPRLRSAHRKLQEALKN